MKRTHFSLVSLLNLAFGVVGCNSFTHNKTAETAAAPTKLQRTGFSLSGDDSCNGSYAKFDQVDLGKALSGRALPLFFPEKSVVTNFFQ